jgi:uncharacterized protein
MVTHQQLMSGYSLMEKKLNELPPNLVFHCKNHGLIDVAKAAIHIATLEGLVHEVVRTIGLAAYGHDAGYIKSYTANESIGIEIAHEVYEPLGLDGHDLEILDQSIYGTIFPRTLNLARENYYGAILHDADHASAGTPDFIISGDRFRLECLQTPESPLHTFAQKDNLWIAAQIGYLHKVEYQTTWGEKLYDAGRQHNLKVLQRMSETATDENSLLWLI